MLVGELRIRIGPVSLPLWRTSEAAVVDFLWRSMRVRLLKAAADKAKPVPIRRWASAKLVELDELQRLARARLGAGLGLVPGELGPVDQKVGESKNLRAALDPDQSHLIVAEQDEGLAAPEGKHEAEAARECAGAER